MAKIPDEVELPPFYGTDFDDVIIDNFSYNNRYYGNGGNDLFVAHEDDVVVNYSSRANFHDDHFYGGMGSDTVTYLSSAKPVMANLEAGVAYRLHEGQIQSTDYLYSIENLLGSNYADSLTGSNGNNTIFGNNGNDHIWGLDGNDTLDGGSGSDSIYGGDGNDQIAGGSSNDVLHGDGGNDTVHGDSGNDQVYGEDGNDNLYGDAGNDGLYGGDGNDQIWGGDGNDILSGSSGNDRVDGGAGNDVIDGGSGVDTVVYTGNGAVNVNLWLGTASGAMGNDVLSTIENVETGGGNDVVYGSFGGNQISTGGGNDVVYAFDGHDFVYGGSGNDLIYGYEGTDGLYGGSGKDTIWGGDDADVLDGGSEDDVLNGEAGNDQIYGGAQNDRVRGGAGDDTIALGSGHDTVVWGEGDTGFDVLTDFNLAEDHFAFEQGYFAVEPTGATDLSDVLLAWVDGTDTLLAANTAADGWVFIARLDGVSAVDLTSMIADESILSVSVGSLGGGAPIEFFG